MELTKKIRSFVLLTLTFVVCSSSVQAGHYGFHGYRSAFYGHHPVGWPRYSSWGAYGNIGFSATTRVRYHAPLYRFPAYRVRYRSFYHAPVAYAGFYRPYFRSFYYSPSYSFYGAWPGCYRTYVPAVSPVIYSYRVSVPICSVNPVISQPAVPQYYQASQVVSPVASVSNLGASTSVVAARSNSQAIPTDLLNVADALCRVGGYREAAEAYGRLATRYNAAEALYARRFVAQLLSNNVEQAVTIAGTADFGGYAIDQGGLPARSLAQLGVTPEIESAVSERLAAYALDRANDPDVFQALSTWFTLVGDSTRSELFLARTSQLRSRPSPSQILAAPDTRLVSHTE